MILKDAYMVKSESVVLTDKQVDRMKEMNKKMTEQVNTMLEKNRNCNSYYWGLSVEEELQDREKRLVKVK